MKRGITPSQTIGPFLHIGLPWPDGPYVVPEGTPDAIWIRGRVFDGDGEPVGDGLVETWQADPEGRFDHPDDPRGRVPGFRGFGRCVTERADGSWAILTRKPGRVQAAEGLQAPHIDVSVFARGLLNRVVTRLYFPEEAEANAADPVLTFVPSELRSTLIAESTEDGYRFDIRLQGDGETVFFDV